MLCPILVLAAVKYEDMVVLKHKRVYIYILYIYIALYNSTECVHVCVCISHNFLTIFLMEYIGPLNLQLCNDCIYLCCICMYMRQ